MKIKVYALLVCLLATSTAQAQSFGSAAMRKLQMAEFAISNFYVDKVDDFLPGAFVKPTFRGKKDGLMAFREYLNRNLVYDTKLYEAGVYGTVRVEFYIEPDGTITLVGASESPHPALTEHVQKLILDTSGQWTPLLEMGHPCRYLISFPVNFDPGESTSYATGIPL